MRKRRFNGFQITVAALLLLCLLVALATFRGVCIKVNNPGGVALKDVEVAVSDRVVSFGDIAPGASRRKWIIPSGSTWVSVSYTDPTGRRIYALRADTDYIGPGVGGSIEIDLTGPMGATAKDNVGIGVP